MLDLTQALAGPYCTMLLADLGADVIKVEPPAGDMSRSDGTASRGSQRMRLRRIFRERQSQQAQHRARHQDRRGSRRRFSSWSKTADAVVENAKTGVMDRAGIGYERLREINPALVYAAIRGFGDPRTGASPYADWPAFDIVAQSMGGLVAVTGPEGGGGFRSGPGRRRHLSRHARGARSGVRDSCGAPNWAAGSSSTSRCTTRFSRCAR